MSKLTDKAVAALAPREKPFKVSDGNGLYLVVTPAGAKLWRMDYQLQGRRGTAALGAYANAGGARGPVSLVKARAERDRCRALLAAGVRPADDKAAAAGEVRAKAQAARAAARADRQARQAAAQAKKAQRAAEYWSVERVAEAWAVEIAVGKTEKHANQVRQSLADHVYPWIGARAISSITTADVLDVLGKLFDAGKAETARKVRQRLGKLWKFAVLKHYATADIVTPVRDITTDRLKAARTLRPPGHFASIEPSEAPALMMLIRGYSGSPVTRAAALVLAYTFVRTGELRGARWSEFQLDGDTPTWTIPVARMKVKLRGDQAADDHIVPLSRQAVQVLTELRDLSLDRVHVFPHSRKAGKTMSENTVLYALWELGYRGRMTGHGFRSLASTMLNEAGFDSALVEAQLAHEKPDRIEAAYNRAKHLERRRLMMQSYADMLDVKAGGIVEPIATGRGA